MIIVVIGVMIVEIITRERDDLLPQLKPKQGGPQGTLLEFTLRVFIQVSVLSQEQLYHHPKDTRRAIEPTQSESNASLTRLTLKALKTCSNFSTQSGYFWEKRYRLNVQRF